MTEQNRTPAGVPTGGQFAATDRPEPSVRLVADQVIPPRVKIPLAGGGQYEVRREHLAAAVGIDHDGNLIAAEPDFDGPYFVALTACCQATATGTEDAVACRGCYREIDPGLGAPIPPTDIADRFAFANTPEMNQLRANAAVEDARAYATHMTKDGTVGLNVAGQLRTDTVRCAEHLNVDELAAWLAANPTGPGEHVTYRPVVEDDGCITCR